ncbi:MAG TPA: carboxymuconolactone decarboxylase family protein [Actinophytocola sp.]|uniref:carboxymuconolactone decarboxylase family protein n=1 Tax=Actinophytocola sp. TaxID=1872138 RepID=UPI002DDD318C|nr:carboxymuconolactone decarboxylase family protein [Actinophytocola sp.]HEV2782381.1 carboxymuconolactone decarboxylase family protein [Actinophytocola sp.]
MNIAKLAPEAYKHMYGLEQFLANSTLPATIKELVKLRVSQLNGCGFCVDMHSHDLKAAGETDERLFTVVAWREAPYFTEQERAALALAEEATRLGPEGVSDAVWDKAKEQFDEQTLAALVVAIATINAWNRYGVTLRLVAGSHRRSQVAVGQ